MACGNTVARPGARDAVQALVPPVVRRNAEALDGGRIVHHLRDLFLERHARESVRHAPVEGGGGVVEDRSLLRRRNREQDDGGHGKDRRASV